MASSTALTLANRVLRLTGDANQQAAIVGSVGGIAERIVEFINIVISDVEKKANWPFLRVDSSGVADGVSDTYTFVGTENVRIGGAVGASIQKLHALQELSPEQFDVVSAEQKIVGRPQYFQRKANATSGLLEIQIYPLPVAGDVINVTAYKKATRLTTVNTSVTEIDDDILVYGALMHLDAYDGIDRGYASLYRYHLDTYLMEAQANRSYRVMVDTYR